MVRVVVPTNIKKLVLAELHKQHPGIVRMKSLARLHVWYPNVDKDVESLVKLAQTAKRSKINRRNVRITPGPGPRMPWIECTWISLARFLTKHF